MWVFGYGSLMWDGWETKHGCTRKERASLPGYERDFNKASIENWGSREHPGPTLGLRADAAGKCEGLAFQVPDGKRERVVDSSGPHHQDSGEAKIRESTAGVSRKPSSDGKACGCSSKHLCGLTAWNT